MLFLTFQQMQVDFVSLISHIWVLPIFFISVRRPFPPFSTTKISGSRNLNDILGPEILREFFATFTKGSEAPGDRIELHLLLASITLQDLAGIPVVTKSFHPLRRLSQETSQK